MTHADTDRGAVIPGGDGPEILSVSRLTGLIKGLLEEAFSRVWVEGEITNFTRAQSGHIYFTLKDESNQVKAAWFLNRQRGQRLPLENGLRVLVKGQVSVYGPRGEYQILVDALEPRGMGLLQIAFERLKARLREEGLFDPERKRPLPFLPSAVGVVTSPTGAAIRDIIKVMRRRFAGVGIVLWPARVQGEGAAGEIARGIREMNRYGKVDVLIVGRGGGSAEDLWAFNEEEVARAIHASRIPVISAVGHEVDFTIADFVADLRAPTPSAAAEMVVRSREHLGESLATLEGSLRTSLANQVRRRRQTLDALLSRPALSRPETLLRVPRQRLDEAELLLAGSGERMISRRRGPLDRLEARRGRFDPRTRLAGMRRLGASLDERLTLAARRRLEEAGQHLRHLGAQLHALSPLAVMERGYSITRTVPDLRVIRDASTVAAGDPVSVRLFRGHLRCLVTGTHGEEERT
jgi:exodeoxyribonuclease VII large subunit